MNRFSKRFEPYNRTGQTPVSIGLGGTDSETSEQARVMLGIMDSSTVDEPTGPISLDTEGKILTDRINLGTGQRLIVIDQEGKIPKEAASVIQGIVPTVKTPSLVISGQPAKFLITNFDINTTYDITSDTGIVSLTGNEITYLSSSASETGRLSVNGFSYSFRQESTSINKPIIISPSKNAVVDSGDLVVNSSAFSSPNAINHESSDWELSASPNMVSPVSSYQNTTSLLSYKFTGLIAGTTYYVRVRYNSSSVNSGWSEIVEFSTRQLDVVLGSPTIYRESSQTLRISNYSPTAVYTVTATGGTVSRNADLITFVSTPGYFGPASITVNGTVVTFTILGSSIEKPVIISPQNLSLNTPIEVNFQASVFVNNSGLTLRAALWEISKFSDFSVIAVTREVTNTSDLTKVVISGLELKTTYFCRMKYLSTSGDSSVWSDSIRLTTKSTYPASKLIQMLTGEELYPKTTASNHTAGMYVKMSDSGNTVVSYNNLSLNPGNPYTLGTILRYERVNDSIFTPKKDKGTIRELRAGIGTFDLDSSCSTVIYTFFGDSLDGGAKISSLLETTSVPIDAWLISYGRIGNWSAPVAISGDGTTAAFVDSFSVDTSLYTTADPGALYLVKLGGASSTRSKVRKVIDYNYTLDGHPLSLNGDGRVLAVRPKNDTVEIYENNGTAMSMTFSFKWGLTTNINLKLTQDGTKCFISGTTSAYGESTGASFAVKEAGSWSLKHISHPSKTLSGGLAVSNDGTIVYIGSRSSLVSDRYVSVFVKNGNNYDLVTDIPRPAYFSSGSFGSFISCNGDGSMLAIGDPSVSKIFIYN